MLDPDILRLPFEEQIKFFLKKLNIPTERWDDLMGEMHDHAFTVAGAMQADLLADLREAVNSAITEGTSIEQFRESFDAVVQKYGWDYTGEYNWRTRLIYTTNLSTSYGAGRYQQMTDPELLKLKPYWMYLHADHVHQPRLDHLAWHKTVLPATDSWWNTRFPPNGFGCHCRAVAVTEAEGRRKGGLFRRPEGGEVDPGWDYVPGKQQVERDRQQLTEKETRLKDESTPINQWYRDELNDPEIRDRLEFFSKTPGWEEKGGQLIRDYEGNAVGRTKWTPYEPWWGDYKRGNRTGLNEDKATQAINKALAGEKLTKPEARFIDWSVEYIKDMQQLDNEAVAAQNTLSEFEIELLASMENEFTKIMGSNILEGIRDDIAIQMPDATPAEASRRLIEILRQDLHDLRSGPPDE